MEEKNLQLDRMVFFSDAVVAIAITLLALDIKLEHTTGTHLVFTDLACLWKTFAAFVLSFINIANFWKNHHMFFAYIKKIDERMLWFNIWWLFFIVLLPFSTSLVSSYFSDTAAIFVYSLNTLLIAVFQNTLWDYAAQKHGYMRDELLKENTSWQIQLYCNLDMINAALAVVLSFFYPKLAFILLFTRLPMILLTPLLYPKRFREMREARKKGIPEDPAV